MNENTARQGVLCALGADFIWGLAPAYFKLIDYVPANAILAHRIMWSAVFMLVLLTLGRRCASLFAAADCCWPWR